MAARRSSKLSVDMFPFLSVLCSVIGVLMLFLMMVISTRVIEAEERELPVDAAAADGDEGVEDGIKTEDYRRLEKDIAAKEVQLDQRIKDRDELVRKFRELQDLLRQKNQKVAQAEEQKEPPRTLGEKKKVEPVADARFPLPGGLTPLFIEITSKGYLVQPDNKQYGPIKRTGMGLAASFTPPDDLRAFLAEKSKESDRRYLLLLIHPNGVESFNNLTNYLRMSRNRLRLGWEPFSSDWEFIRKKK